MQFEKNKSVFFESLFLAYLLRGSIFVFNICTTSFLSTETNEKNEDLSVLLHTSFATSEAGTAYPSRTPEFCP
jgi:hypothetical protein